MTNKFTKYSQTQNIASSNIVSNDNTTPYSYKDWLERNTGIIPGKEKIQYENYVKDWYNNKNVELTTNESIKEDYIQLLKQLTISFKSEADALWASDIDFDNPEDVEQVIPFYASKLKEIAIYLINKREAIRRAKLKYNMTGTYLALERLFYEYLLKAFTKQQFPGNEYITNVTDVSVLNTIPELSTVRAGFQIFVEELYDDASYFDRDPSVPVSSYFTFTNDATTYLDSLNISPNDYEWLYSTGVSQLCADNPLLWTLDSVLNQYKNGIPISALELYNSNVLNDYNRINLAKKYIGEQQYILSGGYWIPWTSEVKFNFQTGNNWFYWVTGENIFENDTDFTLDPIYLSGTDLIQDGATAGVNITAADIIYTIRDNSLSGAWLRLIDKSTISNIMTARLIKGKNVFAFPYPGYGLSGEDLDWTGRSFSNLDQTFYYLDKNYQAAVYSAYWNDSISSNNVFNPLYINDTTLIEASAKAAEKFSDADYIITRTNFRDNIQDFIYTGEQKYAWLYKMLKTDLPIKTGINNLYWPFERYENSISMFASSTQCAPKSLSSVDMKDFVGAVAGYNSNLADKIFKKISPNSVDYSEGAWLSGQPLPALTYMSNAYLASGCYQPNLSMKILGGSYGSFIWIDNTVTADSIFNNVNHSKDCWYLKDAQFSLYKEKPTQNKGFNYNQWQDCSCRAILYSPLGHHGNTFDEYEGMADFIIAVTTPMSSFSFKDWRGIDGKDYLTSNEFGWFKLNLKYNIEPDVGWGSGNWVTNTNNTFMLSAGVLYLYYRNDMHRDNPNSSVPYYIIKYKNTNNKTQWIKLHYDKNSNTWKDTGIITDMYIKPGDMIEYTHNETYSMVLTSITNQYCIPEVPVNTDYSNFITGVPSAATTVFQNLTSFSNVTQLSSISSVKTDYYIYTNNAINFILNIALSGWNYNNSSYDGISLGARPIWVMASDKDNDYTKQKGIDIWSGAPVLVDEYNFITQPPYSDMTFSTNTYIEYNNRENNIIVWKQPILATYSIEDKKWCKILVDTNGISNLYGSLYNNINDLIISATDLPSDIILDIVSEKPLLVNYYARNIFSWNQEISNSSLGIPPTGGVWIPISHDSLIIPDAPYAHLSNRHYPTYASVPSVADLYSTKDSGGYFIPRLLGVSVAIAKTLNNVLSTEKLNNDPNKRGLTTIYRNIDIYNSDRGLSYKDQLEPVLFESEDLSWMKASITESKRAGAIAPARDYQSFIPYQTRYESIKTNDNGLFRQEDAFDPWYGDLDNVWKNDIDWPANWRGQYDITDWYTHHNLNNNQVYQWKTDIFGNQYAVLKNNINSVSIYDKKHSRKGTLWTRNARNIIEPASASLESVFEFMPTAINMNSIVNGSSGLLDIDIWFDTLMIYASTGLFFFHLNYDYDNDVLSSTSDEINYILTDKSKFGGTWFFEDDKNVTICTLLSCGNQIRPILRSLDLETNQMSYLYNITSDDTNMASFALTSYEHPVLTYDYITKTYNISYIGYNSIKSGMYITSINIRNYGEYYAIVSAKTIIPSA